MQQIVGTCPTNHLAVGIQLSKITSVITTIVVRSLFKTINIKNGM